MQNRSSSPMKFVCPQNQQTARVMVTEREHGASLTDVCLTALESIAGQGTHKPRTTTIPKSKLRSPHVADCAAAFLQWNNRKSCQNFATAQTINQTRRNDARGILSPYSPPFLTVAIKRP